jgi:hypothetical protein
MSLLANYSKWGYMLQPPVEKAFTLISNAPRKGRALSCLHLLPLTKMGKNQQKLGRYDMGY